jgi:hypothetical protein
MQRGGAYYKHANVFLTSGASHFIATVIRVCPHLLFIIIHVLMQVEFILMLRPISIQAQFPVL